MGKAKKIGTETETAVVNVLLANGWPEAERRALAGEHDRGDIIGTPLVTWQVKGGHMAEGASDNLVESWLDEANAQRETNGDNHAVLVWKRFAVGPKNAHRWWAAMWAEDVWELLGPGDHGPRGAARVVICRMTLEDAIALLHHGGYGDGR